MWKPDRGDFSPRVGFAYDVTGKGTTVVRGGFSIMYSSFTVGRVDEPESVPELLSSVSLAANPTGAAHRLPAGSTVSVSGTTLGGNRGEGRQFHAPARCAMESRCRRHVPAARQLYFRPMSAIGVPRDPGPCNLMAVDPNLKTPYVMNFSLGVTHAFTQQPLVGGWLRRQPRRQD